MSLSEEESYPHVMFHVGPETVLAILINMVLDYENEALIYIVTHDRHRALLLEEVERRFSRQNNIHLTNTHLFGDVLTPDIRDVVVIDGEYVPLHPRIMEDFMRDDNIPSVLVAKVKNAHSSYEILQQLDNNISVVYGGMMKLSLTSLQQKQPPLNPSELGRSFFYMNNGHLCQECVFPIRTRDDRKYAEHTYLENRQKTFLQRCYSLWKKRES